MRRIAKKAVKKVAIKIPKKEETKNPIKKVYKKSDILKHYFEQEIGRGKYKTRRVSYSYNRINNSIKKNMLTNGDLYEMSSQWSGGKFIEEKYTKKDVQEYFLEIIEKYCQVDDIDLETIKYMSENKYLFLALKYIFEKRGDVEITSEFVENAIINNNRDLLDFLIEKYDYVMTPEYFDLACKKSNFSILSLMMENKLEIKPEFFDSVVERFGCLEYKRQDKDKFGFIIGKNFNDIAELKIFQTYGFKITQAHFVKITKYGIYISDYQNFGLVINDEIKEICQKNLFFPYQETKFDSNNFMNIFTKEVSTINMKNIIKNYKIKPTLEHLKILCNQKKINSKSIRYMIEIFKFVPDNECLYSIIQNTKTVKIIKYILCHMNVVQNLRIDKNNFSDSDESEENSEDSEDSDSDGDMLIDMHPKEMKEIKEIKDEFNDQIQRIMKREKKKK
jgi:hypothetical protein